MVRFAAETNAVLDNAYKKRIEKKCDMIIATIVLEGVGFNAEDNQDNVVTPIKKMASRKSNKKAPCGTINSSDI
jgi:phosphopantothenoylcysteine synthetase/decarboxylase